MDANTPLGRRLKEAREAAKMSQWELAVASHVTPGLVSQYENGKRRPGSDNLKKLARALGCSADRLLGLDSGPLSDAPDATDTPTGDAA